MYRHFSTGDHPCMESRRHLDRTRRGPGPSGPESPLAIQVVRPFDSVPMGGGMVDVWVILYVQPGLHPIVIDKIASDFAAPQAAAGGGLIIRIIALLAPDASRATTLAHLARWHSAHPTGDETLGAWLADMSKWTFEPRPPGDLGD